MNTVTDIAFLMVFFFLGMVAQACRSERAPAPVVMTMPADCRPHHVGEVAAIVIIDNEARCLVSEFDVPKKIWLDYLHAKVVAK